MDPALRVALTTYRLMQSGGTLANAIERVDQVAAEHPDLCGDDVARLLTLVSG